MVIIQELLWLQTAYAIWQFIRYTKFLRLPYVVLSSTWNSGLRRSWFQRRKFLWVDGEAEFNTESTVCLPNEPLLQSEYGFCSSEAEHTFFKIGKKGCHFFVDSRINVEMSRLLSYHTKLSIAHKMIPIYTGIYIIKCIPLEKALIKVMAGAKVKMKEEYCILDETTEDYLNENLLRILSILPLSLQAKGFDVLSTLLSAAVLLLDLFSVPANAIWQSFLNVCIRDVKLLLALFPERIRTPLHCLLSSGSQELMYSDIYRKKSYWSSSADFLILKGNSLDPEFWQLKNTLKGQKELTENNRDGNFMISGQEIRYRIFEIDQLETLLFPAHKYAVSFTAVAMSEITLVKLNLETVQYILHEIEMLDHLPYPPVGRVEGTTVYFVGIEVLINQLGLSDSHHIYSSPSHRIYCS